MLTRFLILLVSLAAPAQAAAASVATIEMSSFKFRPEVVELNAGTPTILQLHNASAGAHSFSAPQFFRAAQLDSASAGLVRDGSVDVPAHQVVRLKLTPVRGQYALKCSHMFHAALGMRGTIIVR